LWEPRPAANADS